MTRIAIALCAFGLAGLACGATPAEDFTARGKELLANKEARSDAERLRRLLDISWEYTVKESPEFSVEGHQFPFQLLQLNQMGGVHQNVAQEWVAKRKAA